MRTDRLDGQRLAQDNLDAFHRLLSEPEIQARLLSGRAVNRAWCSTALAASDRLFEEHGIGLWILRHEGNIVGFAGFHRPHVGAEPEITYAFLDSVVGRGLATEIAGALVERAFRQGFYRLTATVDESHKASIRVLERVGYRCTGLDDSEHGDRRVYEIVADRRARARGFRTPKATDDE